MSKPIKRLASDLTELKAYVDSIGPRKTFLKGDVVVLTQYPYGLKNMEPGDKFVVVDSVTPSINTDGPIAAAELADYVGLKLEEGHPQGFFAVPLNSQFFVLEKDYVPAPETEVKE